MGSRQPVNGGRMKLQTRIAALESRAGAGLHIVIVEDGETPAAALERLGLPPDARVVYCTPLDALL